MHNSEFCEHGTIKVRTDGELSVIFQKSHMKKEPSLEVLSCM